MSANSGQVSGSGGQRETIKFATDGAPMDTDALLAEIRRLRAVEERCRGVEKELERVQGEVVGNMTRVGVFMLEQNPCAPGEIAAAIKRLAYERLLLAQLAAVEPQFYHPLHAMAAKVLRDRLLKEHTGK